MKKILQITIFIFTFTNCYLHHANISGDGYGIKTLLDFKGKKKEQLPVRIEFDPRAKLKIKDYLKRKGQNVEISSDLIDTYYSEEIISKFKNNEYFFYTPDANVKIKIQSSIEEVRVPLFTYIANIATLGLFPAITRTYGRIEYNLFDTEQNKILKTYKYGIEHRQLFGFSSAVLGAILPSTSERFDHSRNERSFSVMRVAFNQFNIDLLTDLEKDNTLASRFQLSKPSYYAMYLEPNNLEKNEKLENLLLSRLETELINYKFNLVERKKIKKIIEEIKLYQYGLTDSKRLEFGKLLSADNLLEVTPFEMDKVNKVFRFSVRCISVESGQILWSETVSSGRGKSDEDSINLAIDKLIRELQLKGVL